MMKDRILQIMRRENMTQQDFAKAIEVSPASLSNIFNGKTNPTNNHVSAIHRRFPDINVNWLMFGEGDMYDTPAGDAVVGAAESDSAATGAEAADAPAHPVVDASPTFFGPEEMGRQAAAPYRRSVAAGRDHTLGTPAVENVKIIDRPQRRIKEIRVFFDDGTYEAFVPSSR